MGRLVDLMGHRYGGLTVVGRDAPAPGGARWICLCDCGKRTVVKAYLLRTRQTKSCGCLRGKHLVGHVKTEAHRESMRRAMVRAWQRKRRLARLFGEDDEVVPDLPPKQWLDADEAIGRLIDFCGMRPMFPPPQCPTDFWA